MGILLTEEEMSQLSQKFPEGFTGRVGLMIAKAQARKIFEEIKTHMRYVGTDNCGYYTISLGEWQTLKKEVK